MELTGHPALLCMREFFAMTTRPVLLLAGAAMLGVSAPAAAQQGHYDGRYESHGETSHAQHHEGGTEHHEGRYEGAWQGEWNDDNTWHGDWNGTYTDAEGRTVDANYTGMFHGERRFVSEDGHVLSHDGHGWREHHGGRHGGGHHSGQRGPRLAYSQAERDQWLVDCQYLMAGGSGYYDDDRDADGGLIGGLLGAVVGGVAGNRIADGDRLLGTAVGAGLGGLAGAAIGSILDGDGDGELSRDEVWASRYCEAYLRRHELGGGEFAYGQRMMMVPVATRARRGHGHRHDENCRTCREVVTEEWVEVETVRPRPRPRPRPTPRPAPRPRGKLTPLN